MSLPEKRGKVSESALVLLIDRLFSNRCLLDDADLFVSQVIEFVDELVDLSVFASAHCSDNQSKSN